jgi:hypothetical protein
VQPQQVALGAVAAGAVASQTVRVDSTAARTLELRAGVVAADPAAAALWTVEPAVLRLPAGEWAEVVVRFVAPRDPGATLQQCDARLVLQGAGSSDGAQSKYDPGVC